MNVKARHSSFLRPERFVSGTRRREKRRFEMTRDEAVKRAMQYDVGGYVPSEKVYSETQSFHCGEISLFLDVCQGVVQKGLSVVDDDVVDLYKIVNNIDHDGERLDESDRQTLILTVKDLIASIESKKSGKLRQAGVVFGIVSGKECGK